MPGDAGVWLFIAADTFMFALFFSSFMYERTKNVALFNTSQQALNPAVGALNTVFLLTGSWFVAMAVEAARKRLQRALVTCLGMAVACGVAFGAVKIFEYRSKIVHGAVSMVDMALKELAEKNVVQLDDERRASMVSNLMVVLCGEAEVHPIINTGTLYT